MVLMGHFARQAIVQIGNLYHGDLTLGEPQGRRDRGGLALSLRWNGAASSPAFVWLWLDFCKLLPSPSGRGPRGEGLVKSGKQGKPFSRL